MAATEAGLAGEPNLLFGMLALQLRFVSSEQLIAAGAVWSADPSRGLGEILLAHNALTPGQHAAIVNLLAEQLAAHNENPAEVYQLFGGDNAAMSSFGGSLDFVPRPAGSEYRSLRLPLPSGEPDAATGPEAAAASLPPEHAGRYRLRGEQGRGGIGRVLIAFDGVIQREIALKELLPSAAESSGAAQPASPAVLASQQGRFLREARITGQLEHPGIVPVYELGQRPDGTVYYTMKLVRGRTLAQKLQDCHGLGDRLALLPHFLDLCQAIAYAHSRGVTHRDIKPANVMVGEFGETMLLDWGLAKVQGQLDESAEKLADEVRHLKEAGAGDTVDGRPIGTPSYMPPEQADGRIAEVDQRSDVWSLGAVLYEVLTGRPPFTGSGAFEVIGAVLIDEVLPVQERCPEAPPELAAIAMRCLQRAPAERYQSVEQLAADVTAFSTGGLVSAYSYSTTTMLRRWAARQWKVLATAGIALLVLAVSGVFGYRQVVLEKNAALAANRKLDQSQSDLLGFKLLTESKEALAHEESETASLLAIEAAERAGPASTWQASLQDTMRECLSSPFGRDIPSPDGVLALDYSPDGSLLAAAYLDHTVRLYDPARPAQPPQILRGHAAEVFAVAFTPDGRWLASGGNDDLICLWKSGAWEASPVSLAAQCGQVMDLAISRDGRHLAAAGANGKVQLWSLESPDAAPRTLDHRPEMVRSLCFSADGAQLAACDTAGSVWLWQLEDPAAPPTEHWRGAALTSLAFSSDGRLLAGSGSDRNIYVWDAQNTSAPPLILHGHTEGVIAAAFSPDGKVLASTSADRTVRLWDTHNLGQPPRVLDRVNGVQGAPAFSPDGGTLATAAPLGPIRLWDFTPAVHEPTVLPGQLAHEVWHAALSPDGKRLAAGGMDRTVQVWQADDPDAPPVVLQGHTGNINHLAFSPDGRLLASASEDRTVRVWETGAAFKLRGELTGHTGKVYDVVFSRDGRSLASSSEDKTVRVWHLDAAGSPPTVLAGHQADVFCLALSPDGRQLASGSFDSTIRIWPWLEASPQATELRGHEHYVWNLVFSPDGQRLASASWDHTVRVWHLDDPRAEPDVLKGHVDLVWHVAFSADGRWLASGCGDGLVRVWSMADLSVPPAVLAGHDGAIRGEVRFSPDGSLLASASADHTIRLWRTASLAAAPAVLRGHAGTVYRLLFRADGRELLTASADGSVRLWHTQTADMVELLRRAPRRNLSQAEWKSYVGPDYPYERTLPGLPAGP